MSQTRRVLGSLGEQAACDDLVRRGYRIVARNYRVRSGEIDIVCEQDGVLVFCEVKTRTSAVFGLPEEAVTASKRRRLRRLGAEYLQRERVRARAVRFDVVSVNVDGGRVSSIRHIPNAF
ncbi:MAG TPA: YraN family protein [Actinomycetota bacterium]|nr:YraN family protein [Actinomycetota bacterium]